MSVKPAETAGSSTREWDAAKIALFRAENGDMIAYVPSDRFKIEYVIFVRNGRVSYRKACLGDSTRIKVDDHVLYLVDGGGQLAQKLTCEGTKLTYSDPKRKGKRLFVSQLLDASDQPKPGTYTLVRDQKSGRIVGFTLNR